MRVTQAHRDEVAAARELEESGDELQRLDALASEGLAPESLMDVTRYVYLSGCAADQASLHEERGEEHKRRVGEVDASTRGMTEAWRHLEASERRLARHRRELEQRSESAQLSELADLWLRSRRGAHRP